MQLQENFPQVRLQVIDTDSDYRRRIGDGLAGAKQALWLETFDIDLDKVGGVKTC